jgi:double-stranded uracil-DNA glycosylase
MPTRAELAAADGIILDDLVRPDLRLLLVGINPGRHSGVSGFHFGNARNYLWSALYRSGLTPGLLAPSEGRQLLALGIGITNLVMRTSAGSDGIEIAEYESGAGALREKVARLQPRMVAILTKHGYEKGFKRKVISFGPQPTPFGGVPLWVLPNPSPRNPRFSAEFHEARFSELRKALEELEATSMTSWPDGGAD